MRSFDALMALASKQTEASQIALAKETQIREAREKAKRLEEERKEKERIRIEKQRLAKQKLEDEEREKRLLEERQKKMAERLAAAELARKPQEHTSTAPSSSSRANNRPKSSTSHRISAPRTSSLPPNNHLQDPEEQRMLEREEKKARARARLFGEPVSAHKKPVIPRGGTQSAQRRTNASKGTPSLRGTAFGSKLQTSSGSSTSLTARQRIEQQFSANERKPLNQNRKDRRTIEEIEQDMKQKKTSSFVGTGALSRKTQELSLEFDSRNRASSPVKSTGTNSALKERPAPESASTVKRKLSASSAAPPSKRPSGSNAPAKTTVRGIDSQRSVGGSKLPSNLLPRSSYKGRVDQSDDEDDSESEGFSDQDVQVAPAIRDEIWKIMGKDRNQYTAKPIYSDEDSDDMEADIDDVLEEEGRAARLAKIEDQREEERLKQHELDKKKRLLQNRLSK